MTQPESSDIEKRSAIPLRESPFSGQTNGYLLSGIRLPLSGF